jgi:hypothetical protein
MRRYFFGDSGVFFGVCGKFTSKKARFHALCGVICESLRCQIQKSHQSKDWWLFSFGAPSMGAHLRVQVPLQAGHSEQSEAQLHEGDRVWEGSAERKS